ncbi:hypothetical protein ACFL5G_05340 [Candidatus Margulisiibacteriota bacterium]
MPGAILRRSVYFCVFLFLLCATSAFPEEVELKSIEVTGAVVATSPIYTINELKITANLAPTSDPVTFTDMDFELNPAHDEHYSSENALTLEADNVSYLEENRFVEATGNVLVIYKTYHVSANQTELDVAKDQLKIKEGFIMKRSEQRFEGRFLDYNLAKDEGIAREVSLDFGGAYVKGRKVEILKDRLIVHDAEFTRCNGVPPCYKFKAKVLTIYPEWNMMVATDAVFHVNIYPVMYVPTYVVEKGSSEYSDVIPEFGRNRTEGNFVKAKLGYHENEKIQGNWDVQYLEKLWYRVGFTNRYIWDDISAGNIRLHYVGAKGFTGGFTHRTLLGVESRKKEQRIENFFLGILPPSAGEYPELVWDASSREILGDQFVSFLPMLTFNSARYELGIKPWYWKFSLSAADILEELARDEDDYGFKKGDTHRFRRQRWTTSFLSQYDWMPLGMLHGGITYDKSGYYSGAGNRGYWYRLSSNWGFGRRIDWWDYSLGYSHLFDEGGFSPFVFDQFNLSTWDEWSIGTGFWFNDIHRLGYHIDYAVREDELRNEDISLDMRLHHWQLSLIFRLKLQQTLLSVTLL